MWSITLFAIIFVGFFVLRGIAATILFYFLLPGDNRCPICDKATLRIAEPAWNRLMPWFRTSWCYHCGWEGLLRPGELDEDARIESQAGQLPLSSKKSS